MYCIIFNNSEVDLDKKSRGFYSFIERGFPRKKLSVISLFIYKLI